MPKKTVKKKTKKAKKQNKPVESVEKTPAVNPEFEKAAQVTEPPIENRGGFRPGAGRPPGLTDEKAKVKNLPQYPSIPIRQGAQALFDLWASAAKIEKLALSDEEADLASLPATQLAEYYFPNMIPEIAGAWVMMIFATTRIMKPRIKLIDEVRQQRRKAKPKTAGPGDTIIHFTYGNGQPLHAVPAGEACTFSDDVAKINCPVCRDMLDKSKQN